MPMSVGIKNINIIIRCVKFICIPRLCKMTKLETGYSYKYTPEKDSEDIEARDRDNKCCGCGESSMKRSLFTTLYSMIEI